MSTRFTVEGAWGRGWWKPQPFEWEELKCCETLIGRGCVGNPTHLEWEEFRCWKPIHFETLSGRSLGVGSPTHFENLEWEELRCWNPTHLEHTKHQPSTTVCSVPTRAAGGSFSKKEQAQEDQYFHNLVSMYNMT